MILVNKPYLPDFEEYVTIISSIWENNHLTNDGPLSKKLECELCNLLNVKNLCLVNNCTNGLLMTLNDFSPEDEIITTPFSFIATTSSIIWSKLKPVFCDIEDKHFFIDCDQIKKLITNKTKAVLATHVYGNTGDIDKLISICKEYGLRLIFDAAHAFGVKYRGKSILDFGDMSVISFHATKLFHTVEGGAICCNDDEFDKKMRQIRNFGYDNYVIKEVGINSKMSEFHAAMGLLVIKNMNKILQNRINSHHLYDSHLDSSFCKKVNINKDIEWNYSYYPLVISNEKDLIGIMELLKTRNIFARRYFYPSLHNLKFADSSHAPLSDSIAKRMLCLPLYDGITENEIIQITDLINSYFKKS